MNLKKIIQIIKNNKVFLISTHTNPDPDALCCELALYEYLRSLKKKVFIVNEEATPQRFCFLPQSQRIQVYQKSYGDVFDAAFIVDCGDLGRIGKVHHLISQKTKIINIDHHVTNDSFGHVNLIKPNASSTAEVLFDFFQKVKFPMNQNVALCLYTGIMTDTGSFRYDNTTSHTHQIVAELMQYHLSTFDLYRKLYEMIPLNDLRMFSKVMNTFESFHEGKTICLSLKKQILKRFSDKFDLKDTIFKFLRAIEGVEVVVILTQLGSQKTRVNLRSSGHVDVAKLAQHFEGGGHKRASGCVINRNLTKSRRAILQWIREKL